jgi:acyl-CoA thioesterase I
MRHCTWCVIRGSLSAMPSKWLILFVLLAGCGGGSVDGPPASVQKQSFTVAFMGDSITAAMDTAVCVPGSFNAGIPGNFTWQMADRFQRDVLDKKPSVVVIMGGTNDVAGGAFPLVSIGPLYEMADMAKRAGVIPILATIPPNSDVPTTWGWGPHIVPAWNAMIKGMASQAGFAVVDYYPLFLNADGSQNMALYDNPSHPSKAGHAMMCEAVKAVIAQIH